MIGEEFALRLLRALDIDPHSQPVTKVELIALERGSIPTVVVHFRGGDALAAALAQGTQPSTGSAES